MLSLQIAILQHMRNTQMVDPWPPEQTRGRTTSAWQCSGTLCSSDDTYARSVGSNRRLVEHWLAADDCFCHPLKAKLQEDLARAYGGSSEALSSALLFRHECSDALTLAV